MAGLTRIARTAGRLAQALRTSFPSMAVAVTPSDVTVFEEPSTVFVGGAGTIVVVPWAGTASVSFVFTVPGIIPVLVKQVLSSGTDATNMVRVYEPL